MCMSRIQTSLNGCSLDRCKSDKRILRSQYKHKTRNKALAKATIGALFVNFGFLILLRSNVLYSLQHRTGRRSIFQEHHRPFADFFRNPICSSFLEYPGFCHIDTTPPLDQCSYFQPANRFRNLLSIVSWHSVCFLVHVHIMRTLPLELLLNNNGCAVRRSCFHAAQDLSW